MATLDRRIKALEQAGGGDPPQTLFLREIVAAGRIGKQLRVAEIEGERIDCAPAETESQFIARVSAIAREWHDIGRCRLRVILNALDEDVYP